jgi:hypothetical protein
MPLDEAASKILVVCVVVVDDKQNKIHSILLLPFFLGHTFLVVHCRFLETVLT